MPLDAAPFELEGDVDVLARQTATAALHREALAVLDRVHWLWSDRTGVFSHETALQLHQLSDALPSRVYMTLPLSWAKRRLRVPEVLRLSFDSFETGDVVQLRGVPVTAPARTVNDCARAFVQPDLVQQAVREGLDRRLFEERCIGPALTYVQEQCG